MATRINGQTYYRTSEACQKAGISKATLFRWCKAGILEDVVYRDRNGWRLFTENDINRIKAEATRISGQRRPFEETGKVATAAECIAFANHKGGESER